MVFIINITISNFINLKIDNQLCNLEQLKIIYKSSIEDPNLYYKSQYILYYILDQYNQQIPQQYGGKLYKINKYLSKIKLNNNKMDKYLIKYNYYKKLYYGGSSSSSTASFISNTSIIDKIINETVKFNLPNFNCENNITHDYDYDDYNDEKNCIDTLLPMPTERLTYDNNITKYFYRRVLKSISTDTFMAILSSNEYKEYYKHIFDSILIQLYLCFSKCIYLFNIKYNKNLSEKVISLLYKGGNSIRLLMRQFSDKSGLQLPSGQNIDTNMKVGDWDFTIKCDYIELKEQLGKDLLIKLIDYIKRSMAVALTNIKKLLEENELLNSDDFIQKFKTDCTKECVSILENPNSNCTNPTNSKSSFIIIDDDKIKENKIITKKIIGINTFFINEQELKKNKIFIVYIDKISSYGLKSYIDFSLYRLKINNIINIDNKTYNSPIELIDISITNYTEHNYNKDNIFNNLYLQICNNKPKYIKNKYNLNNIIISFNILSADYMFVDITTMLFLENYFPWHDKKYEKRLSRLLKLYIITNPSNSSNAHELKKENFKLFISKIGKILGAICTCEYDGNILKSIDDQIYKQTLTQFYNNHKTQLNIQDKNSYNYISFNDNETNIINDPYLLIIYNNIYENIIFLMYLYNQSAVTPDHCAYCKEIFTKLKECDDSTNCNQLNMVYYSYTKIQQETNILFFINYLITLYKLSLSLIKHINNPIIIFNGNLPIRDLY